MTSCSFVPGIAEQMHEVGRAISCGFEGLSGLLFDGCFDFGFWIADFGFPGTKSFFEESEFSLAINFQ